MDVKTINFLLEGGCKYSEEYMQLRVEQLMQEAQVSEGQVFSHDDTLELDGMCFVEFGVRGLSFQDSFSQVRLVSEIKNKIADSSRDKAITMIVNGILTHAVKIKGIDITYTSDDQLWAALCRTNTNKAYYGFRHYHDELDFLPASLPDCKTLGEVRQHLYKHFGWD